MNEEELEIFEILDDYRFNMDVRIYKQRIFSFLTFKTLN